MVGNRAKAAFQAATLVERARVTSDERRSAISPYAAGVLTGDIEGVEQMIALLGRAVSEG